MRVDAGPATHGVMTRRWAAGPRRPSPIRALSRRSDGREAGVLEREPRRDLRLRFRRFPAEPGALSDRTESFDR